MVVLEAYAAGRPVVGTRAPGLADTIVENHTGWLAAPDDVSSLSQAIQPALGDAPLTDALGRNARRHVADFSWRSVALKYLELFAQTADQRRTARAA